MQEIQTLSNGDFFKRKEGGKKVYQYGGYCRTNKAYVGTNWDDISDFIYIKKSKQVFTNFEF